MVNNDITEKREERKATSEELRNLAGLLIKRSEAITEAGR